jgi:hypothetical protein
VHLYLDATLPPDQLLIVALLVVLFCVWSIALANAWRRRHQ